MMSYSKLIGLVLFPLMAVFWVVFLAGIGTPAFRAVLTKYDIVF